MFSKKSLVLLGTANEEAKAVLTLEKKDDIFEGRVRLYNFPEEPKGIVSIGFYCNEKVVKAGLSRVSSMLYNFKVDTDSMTENFSCAIINTFSGESNPILYGNTLGQENRITTLGKVMSESFENIKSVEEVEKTLDEKNIDYTDELREEIEQEIDKNMACDCSNCKYKKAFFEAQSTSLDSKKLEARKEDVNESKNFYSEVKNEIETLFSKFGKEEYLEDIIPNSKWVKVELEDDGDYYIIGLIYEGEELKYIAYGVPGIFQKSPPKEIAGYPVWLPLDKAKPESFGYWISYQDAESGESIKAVIE